MLTLSGRRVSVLHPDPSDIVIEDLAHGLALVNRFGGQIPAPYSVAQHCCVVKDIVAELDPDSGPVVLLQALFHDAAEGIGMQDLPTPFKCALPEYRALEKRHMAAILARFGLPAAMPEIVKRADDIAFATERRDLFRAGERRLRASAVPMAGHIEAWSWRVAEQVFLSTWRELEAQRGGGRGTAVAV
jgi:hypothetical protein